MFRCAATRAKQAVQIGQVGVLVVIEKEEIETTGTEAVSAARASSVFPPSPMVPTTQVIRSATPACSQIRLALTAFAAASSIEYTRADGAAAAIRSAP